MSTRETFPRHDSTNEPTQTVSLSELFDSADEERTVVIPAQSERTYAGSTVLEPPPARAEKRERRRTARERDRGSHRRVPDPQPDLTPVQQPQFRRTTDRFLGSLGLFVLRIVVAGIMGLHGVAAALDIQGVQAMLGNTLIPEPVIMSYVLIAAEIAIAVALVLGLLTRLAGLGVALIGIGALALVLWVGNPFVGTSLTGELELLLGAVGVLLACLGGGGWSVDRAIRRGRNAEV